MSYYRDILKIPDRMLLSSSICTAAAAVWVQSGGVPNLRPVYCKMTDWDKDKMAGPVWDYSVWTCFNLYWYNLSSTSNGERQTHGRLMYLQCNYTCCKHSAHFNGLFHFNSFVFVGAHAQACLCVWERTREIQCNSVQACVDKYCHLTSCISLQEVGPKL